MTSLIDTYLNYDTLRSDIVISGSVGSGATVNFSTTIPYARTNTRADLYARNTTTGKKMPCAGGQRQNPYTFVSSETCSQLVTFTGGVFTITFSIFNGTGGTISLTAQTMEITAVLYEVPY